MPILEECYDRMEKERNAESEEIIMERITDEDIEMMVQEILFDKEISFGVSTLPTAKRTIKRMNEYLERENCEWRVILTTNKQNKFPYGAKVESEE